MNPSAIWSQELPEPPALMMSGLGVDTGRGRGHCKQCAAGCNYAGDLGFNIYRRLSAAKKSSGQRQIFM